MFWAFAHLSLWAWLMAVTFVGPVGGDNPNNGPQEVPSERQGHPLVYKNQDRAFVTFTETITTTLVQLSTLTTFRSCFTTLVANMPACSSSSLTGRRKRRSSQVIDENVPHLLIQNQLQDFQSFIRASKGLGRTTAQVHLIQSYFQASDFNQGLKTDSQENTLIPIEYPLIPEVHEEPLEVLEGIEAFPGVSQINNFPRKLCWFGCFATTITSTSTIVVQSTATNVDAATQTLAFTTPGCVPNTVLNSLQVPTC